MGTQGTIEKKEDESEDIQDPTKGEGDEVDDETLEKLKDVVSQHLPPKPSGGDSPAA